jgi:cysteine desulfurase
MDKMKVYLDHSATTPVREEVLEAMLPYFKEIFGNASSVHMWGQRARKAVEESREKVAGILGADSREIIFTSCATESNNLAVKGVARARENKGNHIIVSAIEHPAVLKPAEHLSRRGFELTIAPVDQYGLVDSEFIRSAIKPSTILVSIMLANNEVGTIEPIKEIAKIVKEKGVVMHTDAVQAIGKIPVEVNELGVDLLSISGHKIYGPKGVGVLYIRKGTRVVPTQHGGHHEFNRRGGTENVPGIVGLAKAMELAVKEQGEFANRMKFLRDKLEKGLQERIKHIRLNGHPEKRLPNLLNMSFEYVEGESMLLNLDLKGIAVSTGSACTSGSLEPSHVLMAMGLSAEVAHGSLRFSLGRANTPGDIDYVLEVLPQVVEKLREMSPLYKK